MNKIFLFLLVVVGMFVLLIANASADLGTFTQGDCVPIRVQSNGTAVNLSTITTNINGQTTTLNTPMTNLVGNTYRFNFCNTTVLGVYVYDWHPCQNNECVNSFEITPSGQSGSANIVFFIFVILIVYGITAFGFFSHNSWVTILGGMAMIFLGVYIDLNGIIIYRDSLTGYIAILTWALGAMLALWAGIFEIEEVYNNLS